MEFLHYPVMNKEVVDLFAETSRKLFIDCTLGLGGHAYYLLKNFKNCKVIGVDVDGDSIEKARANLGEFKQRIQFEKTNFVRITEKIKIPLAKVSGILVDPGLSLYQIKNQARGFSHSIDSQLDMRKDDTLVNTAGKVINTYSYNELKDIFYEYGEIKKAHGLARRIIEARLSNSIDSTSELKKIVERLYHWKPRRGMLHPAAQVFQALRIYVNRELEDIKDFLKKILQNLKTGCRIIFLTYHSLEDRIVKREFKKNRDREIVKIIKPFPAVPTQAEKNQNPPSRSAKLRAVEIL